MRELCEARQPLTNKYFPSTIVLLTLLPVCSAWLVYFLLRNPNRLIARCNAREPRFEDRRVAIYLRRFTDLRLQVSYARMSVRSFASVTIYLSELAITWDSNFAGREIPIPNPKYFRFQAEQVYFVTMHAKLPWPFIYRNLYLIIIFIILNVYKKFSIPSNAIPRNNKSLETFLSLSLSIYIYIYIYIYICITFLLALPVETGILD